MLRNCYKCYEIVKSQFSGLEIPRLARYLISHLGLYTRGQAGSWELGHYTRTGRAGRAGPYAREDELEKFRW